MKKIVTILTASILIGIPFYVCHAKFGIGLPSVVKKRVEDLDKKVEEKKLAEGIARIRYGKDIKNLKTLTLLLIGDQEVIYEANKTLKRAEELVENIQTALIPNCSHLLIYEQTELVNSHILNFLSGDK